MSIIVRVNIIFLFVFCFIFMSYAEVIPVADRTPAVRDAIVKAIDGVDAAADVTDAQLASITVLNLRSKDISELKAGDFSGLTGLVDLNLYGNKLSELPAGIFEGLTSLTTIRLGGNSVNPMPFTASLERVASGQFKAVAPAGALFDIVLPVTVANGSLTEGVATVTIPKGSVESDILDVTRTSGTIAAVTIDIGTLPSLPSRNHYGYALVKSESLPLAVISGINTAPEFTDGTTVTRSVAENTDAGVDIGTPVGATDTENDALTYTLGGADADAFDIDSATGQLKTKAALDYETKPQYTVTITASDGTLTATITVTINVTDIDEVVVPVDPPTSNTAPSFLEGDSTARAVPENTDAGVNIGTPVSATDTENDALTWTLGGADADVFDIDSTTGQLKTEAALDYETKRVYSVTITVADEALSDTIVVIISVIDVNDTPISAGFVPVADRTPQVRDAIVDAVPNVAAAADVTEAQVAAITSLNLRNKGITSLKTGDFSGMVSLSALNLYRNQLRSVPMGLFNGLSSLTTLRLGGNAIDPLPLIVSLQQVGIGEFRAVMPSGAPFDVVLPIRVTDGSIRGGLRSVAISQGSVGSPAFTVDGTSAKVSFGTLPELPSNHFGYTLYQTAIFNRTPEVAEAILKALDLNDLSAVTDTDIAMMTRLDLGDMDITSLRVDDFSGMLSLQTLTLSNNKLTTLPVGIFSDLTALTSLSLEGNSIATLPSNVFEGLSLLLTLNLDDNELTGLSGTLFDGVPNIRSLSLSNNKLTALPAGIFEGLTQLNQLQLNGNAVDPLSMLVSLQKVGEDQFMARVLVGAPLTLTLPITVKNGEIVEGVDAVTIPIGVVESQPLTVARTPDTIDAVTVDLGTLPNLPASHNGYAWVKSGTLPLQVFEPLNVAPVFTEGDDTVRSIRENTAADVDIGEAVSATDQDTGDTLTYTLGGTDAASFGIDAKTGQLKTKAALDYETKAGYSVVVTVSDGIASDSITVSIVVVDIDENRAPVFSEGASTTRSVAENTDAGENIGEVVSATDADNDTLTYSLGGTDASLFSLVSASGQLRTKAALDYETKNSYSVTITVSDGKLTTPITVVIRITDVTDEAPAGEEQRETVNNPPVFAEGASTTRTVLEGTAAGEDIGQAVTATDSDGHTLTYSLGGTDAAAFSMDSTNGQLRTEAALDYETKSTYAVTITASDGTDTATIDVTINVTDVAENRAPVFTSGASTTRSVAENTGSGVDIGAAIAATDVNEDTLTYSLGGPDASAFSIDSTTGQLRTDASLDYETKTSYTVTITVSDGRGGSDSITVTINVADVDETLPNRSPVFSGESTTRSVAENTSSGVNIGSPISATDADDDDLEYSLGGTDAASFSIDSTTGQLRTDASLDYETKTAYTVRITVYDGKGGTDSITVTINVTDVQENRAPVFTDGTSTTRSVAENTGSGIDIGEPVSATDADDDDLEYSLGGTDAASFSIDSTTGQLRTDASLDYETKTNYTVTIAVSDENGGSDSITVRINVTDADETLPNRAPVFSGASTTRSVAENTGSGIDIGEPVSATDADDDDLEYSLGGTDAASFSIDSTTGQLRTDASLDYETKTAYSVTITVSDGRGGSDSIAVRINVADVDETLPNSAPVFSGESITRSVAENTDAEANIGAAITATDADDDKLTYSLSGTDAASFSIDAATGQLKTKAALDYEKKTAYVLIVIASDGKLTGSILTRINVTNVNEAPEFTEGASATRAIAENVPEDINIGSAVAATDPEKSKLIYTLGGTDAASFSIDAATGQLKTKAALDYEDKDSYSVTITVSDGSLKDTITVTINVTNLDETPSNTPPVFSDGTSTTRSVAENTESDENIGTPVAATDADENTLAYLLGGTDAAVFAIDSKTGQLKTSGELNHETKAAYTVNVIVSDGSGTDTISVTINVTDVNEAPVIAADTDITRSVAENTAAGENIGSAITATDEDDGDTLTWTLGGTDAESFDIVRTSGQLQTKATLDYEDKDAYSVTVNVSDGNLTDSIDITINITDIDENRAPAFSGDTATRSVAEDTGAGQDIGNPITATDADGDDLEYSLGGTDEASFSIVSTSGQLRTKVALDYESKTQYEVTVSVSDGSLEDTIAVTINVTDVQENRAPAFSSDTATRSVAEDTATGQDIGAAITATDADGDDLTYSLGGTDAASFSIVSTSGQLRTKVALDYESKTQYEVTVSVSDGSLEDTIAVTINVTDVQENRAPAFSSNTATRSIAENTGSGQNIGAAITATDADGDDLEYSLGGTDASSFSIVSASGQLQTKAALDYESKSEYSVTVSVSDGTLEDTITVTINVTDVAENSAPVFGEGDTATRSVAEDTGTGQDIGSAVSATDAENDTLTYTLGGTDAASFAIVSTSGQLRTKDALDYETKDSYEVTVSVSDGKGGSDSITVTINVTDVQENRDPVFTDGASTTRSIAENTGSGQNIGSAVSATDADNNSLTYSLGGTDKDSFSIVGTSGQLRTKAALNYETKSEYSVTVSVSDGNGGSDSITVTINVTDVNEAPVFSDGASTTRSIAENTGAGQNIGAAVGAEDPENNSLTYSLGGTDKDSFAIVTSSGQLQTKAALDYESKSSYKVTVSVSDGNGGSASITVTINVTDVSENQAPVFSDGTSTTRSIAENTGAGQDIGSAVAATDPENDTLTYTLGGTDAASFDIVSTSGQLRTKAALDYETKDSYEVTVSVSDGKGGSDSITVTINVSDVNENSAPVFTDGTSTTRSVAENTAETQNIGTPVAATDADSGDSLTYSLGGTDAASFAIVSTSGQLQTKAALDFETKSSYEVTVSVSDGNGGSDSITVTINVTDAQETQTTQTEDTQTTATTITPVKKRSSNVRDAIVAAISGVNSAEDVTAEHLAAIRNLTVRISYNDDGDVIGDNFFLSGDFSGLTDLRTLDISDTEDIENLPSGIFDGLTSLRTLRTPTYYSAYTSGMFDDLTSLRTLNMSESAQSAIPSGIFDKLTNLRTLNMSGGVIETLPSGIFDKLTKLRTLNLKDNWLADLPSGIFDKLTSLRTLDLRENDLDIPTMRAEGFFDNIATAEIKTADNVPLAPAAVSDVSRSTTVLQNYPNPFNPETWIPYQLEAPAKVTVTIYNVRGVVVRKLDLGHKLEGKYISRSRAAYWDGRNSVGEKVAAGLYFYTIKAGDFTATRKMLISK